MKKIEKLDMPFGLSYGESQKRLQKKQEELIDAVNELQGQIPEKMSVSEELRSENKGNVPNKLQGEEKKEISKRLQSSGLYLHNFNNAPCEEEVIEIVVELLDKAREEEKKEILLQFKKDWDNDNIGDYWKFGNGGIGMLKQEIRDYIIAKLKE